MDYAQLYSQIKLKGSFLCVGLDTDIAKIPSHLIEQALQKGESKESAIFEFNRAIVDSTAKYTVSYKLNTAFYEASGWQGILQLERTAQYIKENYPEIFLIADAKRGDIGNTAVEYAKAFFEKMPFDAVTLSPYMGGDAVAPFLKYEGKWVIILALTSNATAEEFETLKVDGQMPLYEAVIRKADEWGGGQNIMFVVGATRPEQLAQIRRIAPQSFFLVPGVGAQGGKVEDVAKAGMNSQCGLLVNSSRGIIYADSTERFAEVAAEKAAELAAQMRIFLG